MISNLAAHVADVAKVIAVSSSAIASCLEFLAGWTDSARRMRVLSQLGHAAAFFGCCIELWVILNLGASNQLLA